MKELGYQAYVYPVDCFYSRTDGNWDVDGNGITATKPTPWNSPAAWISCPKSTSAAFRSNASDATWRGILRSIVRKIIRYELETDIHWRKAGLLPQSFSNLDTDGGWLGYHVENNVLAPQGYDANTL
jgi:hypothetical protein